MPVKIEKDQIDSENFYQVLPCTMAEMLSALKHGDEKGWSILEDWKLDQIHTHPYYTPHLQELRNRAADYHGTLIPAIPFSLFKLFDENGSRTEFQELYMQHRERLIVLAWDVLFNNSDVSDLEDLLWATCDEYSWTLTAHFGYGGTHIPAVLQPREDGRGLMQPHLYEQPELIDLTNACTAASLAEIVFLLEDRLHPAVVYRVRQEVKRRVLDPYMSSKVPFGWEFSTHNWSAVCAGNIGMAAIYMIPDSAMLAPYLLRCMSSVNSYLQGFNDDGACLEGMGYWSYGFSSFMMFADLLKRRTGGIADYFKLRIVHEVALFQQRGYLTGTNGVCFSDANAQPKAYRLTSHYLKSIYPDVTVPYLDENWSMLVSREYPTLVLREFLWSHPDYESTGTPDGETILPFSQWVISHTTTPFGKAAFAIKGGHNDEPHNHNDVGSFLLDVDGEVLIGDLGGGTYNKFYFTDQRYTFLVTGSHGHPLPLINGETQKPGKTYCSKDFTFSIEDSLVTVLQDLAPAYGLDSLTSLKRTAFFDKSTAALTIQDAYAFFDSSMNNLVTERYLTKYPAVQESTDTVRIKGEKHDLLVHAEGLTWTISTDQFAKDGMVPVWILESQVTDFSKAVSIEMTVTESQTSL